MSRSVTFAGALGFSDYGLTDDRKQVIIDRRENGEFASPDPPGWKLQPTNFSQAPTYGDARRSARPYGMRTLPWGPGFSGAGTIDADCERLMPALLAEADKEAFQPGRDLEAWLLPLVEFAYSFLVTPADSP